MSSGWRASRETRGGRISAGAGRSRVLSWHCSSRNGRGWRRRSGGRGRRRGRQWGGGRAEGRKDGRLQDKGGGRTGGGLECSLPVAFWPGAPVPAGPVRVVGGAAVAEGWPTGRAAGGWAGRSGGG